MRLVALVLCWPWLWAYAFGLLLSAALADSIAAPWVIWRRRRAAWPDAPPKTRNASLIVLSFDGREWLRRLLPTLEVAVQRAPGRHEIIVVDNGSRDGSAEWVHQHHPAVRVVRLPENRFFIRGNRAGVAAATGDVLVFVNNDMRVEPDFLAALLERFAPGDVFAVTAGIEMEGERVETGRTRGDFRRGALALRHGDGPEAACIPALWAGGGSSAFDRAKHDALGGFEDLYEPCYAEDLSLSWQAWKRGWRVLLEPRSRVHHAHRGTSVKVFGRARVERLDRRNRELFLWRSVTDPRLLLAHALWLPWNVVKDARRTGLGTQLRALLATLPRLPAALAARQRSRPFVRRGDREVLALANDVRRHARAAGVPRGERLRVLSLGKEDAAPVRLPGVEWIAHTVPLTGAAPALETRLLRVPPRFHATGAAAVRDRVRDLIAETDHDVLWLRDPWLLAAAPARVVHEATVVQVDGLAAATPAELRFLGRVLRRTASVVCARTTDRALAARLVGAERCAFGEPAEVLRRIGR